MCGICGVVDLAGRPVAPGEVEAMLDRLAHRGPDDRGSFVSGPAGLGHVRLSVLDLSPAGRQPMASPDGRFVLVYNGEVYNHLELKALLGARRPLVTRTDTEVVLHAYLEWGPACLERLDGMFALAVYDTRERSLFVARDRFGVKPFYYSLEGGVFAFASEEQALLPLLPARRADPAAVYDYLVFSRTGHGDGTFFEGVRRLPHGACGVVRDGRLEVRRWYDLAASLREPFRRPSELHEAFRESLRSHLQSDVPVGVCLSGGLDSSSIAAVLVKELGRQGLETFSAVYDPGEKADESRFLDELRPLPLRMHLTRPDADGLLADLDRFVACHAEPVATLGPYAQFKVMELAGRHVKVTLDGQGADEMLAGYHYFFASYFRELAAGHRWAALCREVSAYLVRHRSSYALKYLALYAVPGRLKDRLARLRHDHVTRSFFERGRELSVARDALYDPRSLNQSLLEHFEHKLEHLLKWEDRNSMAHSVEARVPFLDHRIVERTLPLPPERKLSRGTTKVFLREAMEGVLPERIRTRPDKLGFATPWDRWLRTPAFQERVLAVLGSRRFRERGYLDAARCLKDYRRHVAGRIDVAQEVWKWLNLELWCERFLDGKAP